jgi:polar amino acid transport system substrate-binding protein
VGIHIPREPFYRKEIDLRISCSYGPGRYDRSYEELGRDYPYSHVRWTENRNMQAALDLMARGKLGVKSLTTHKFMVKEAVKAYDLITGKNDEPYSGILIEYPSADRPMKKTIEIKPAGEMGNIRIGFVGAGAFAQSSLIPHLKGKDIELVGVSTARPANSKSVAAQYGFRLSSADSLEIIDYKDVNAVFIASTHKTHAEYVLESLRLGKPVFCEKPLCTTREELTEIDDEVEHRGGRVMVGFNRRFSAPFRKIAELYSERNEPMAMNYRVNAGYIPKAHWVQDPAEGGRIIGEVCHFVDCMVYLTGELPVRIFAESLSTSSPEETAEDSVVMTIKFSGGSSGSIQYLSNGGKSLPKEYCEVFCERSTAVMDNFTSVIHYKSEKAKKYTFDGKKGHREEVRATIESLRSGGRMPISYDEIRTVTLATFAAVESLGSGKPVEV